MNRLKSLVLGTLLATVSVAAISQNANADTLPQRDSNHSVVAFDYHERNDELRREREIRQERLREYRERQERQRRYRERQERERQYRQTEYRQNHQY